MARNSEEGEPTEAITDACPMSQTLWSRKPGALLGSPNGRFRAFESHSTPTGAGKLIARWGHNSAHSGISSGDGPIT
jgi:hypothetical protein